jgi:hypothetical protein
MIIRKKRPNDFSAYTIDSSLSDAFNKYIAPRLSEEQKEALKQCAKLFAEDVALVYEYELKEGWQEILIATCEITDNKNKKISTKKEIDRVLSNYGEIHFHGKNGFDSFAILEQIKK